MDFMKHQRQLDSWAIGVASEARHAMRTSHEEIVGAISMAEDEILPGQPPAAAPFRAIC
jgi:hypothetical protein